MNSAQRNENESRRRAMAVFAAATAEELERAVASLADLVAADPPSQHDETQFRILQIFDDGG